MQTEQARIVNTEDEQEAVSLKVKEAFKLWSKDSTNAEAAERMNRAMNEAYDTGVRISVEVKQKALDSSEVVNQERYDELKKSNPWMQGKIAINSVQDNPLLSGICRGHVITDTGILSLDVFDVLTEDGGENLAILKPGDIASFTPIPTTR